MTSPCMPVLPLHPHCFCASFCKKRIGTCARLLCELSSILSFAQLTALLGGVWPGCAIWRKVLPTEVKDGALYHISSVCFMLTCWTSIIVLFCTASVQCTVLGRCYWHWHKALWGLKTATGHLPMEVTVSTQSQKCWSRARCFGHAKNFSLSRGKLIMCCSILWLP